LAHCPARLPCALSEKLMVVLRDGRKIIGTMRSFDQFANVVIEHAFERVIVGKKFADVPLGLYVIRGENVVLLGQIVSSQAQTPTPGERAPRRAWYPILPRLRHCSRRPTSCRLHKDLATENRLPTPPLPGRGQGARDHRDPAGARGGGGYPRAQAAEGRREEDQGAHTPLRYPGVSACKVLLPIIVTAPR